VCARVPFVFEPSVLLFLQVPESQFTFLVDARSASIPPGFPAGLGSFVSLPWSPGAQLLTPTAQATLLGIVYECEAPAEMPSFPSPLLGAGEDNGAWPLDSTLLMDLPRGVIEESVAEAFSSYGAVLQVLLTNLRQHTNLHLNNRIYTHTLKHTHTHTHTHIYIYIYIYMYVYIYI